MVTCLTKVTKLGHNTPLTISAELEMEAKMLINHQWPVFSIAEAMDSQAKTEMTIEGTITDLKNAEDQKAKGARTRKRTTKLQKLTLQDDSGSITVCFWGDQVGLCRSLSVGDTIRVANVKSTEFMETITLNSTGMTQVYPVKAASVQTGRIKIIGVVQASKMETTLEAELNEQTPTFVVESKLLAKACRFSLVGDIEEKLLDQMPFFAEVTMQGNKITDIKNFLETNLPNCICDLYFIYPAKHSGNTGIFFLFSYLFTLHLALLTVCNVGVVEKSLQFSCSVTLNKSLNFKLNAKCKFTYWMCIN